MFTAALRVAALALIALPATLAGPSASAQAYGQSYRYQSPSYGSGYAGCGQACGHDRAPRRDYSYQGQADVPGDYRCDAYWDASRTDCNAAWRDQRSPWQRNASHRGQQGYGQGYGGAVYPGAYGRPDVVYSGGGYSGGAYPDRYGHDHSRYGQSGRDPQRVNWCCAEYRSYDPATGYYVAYSGERIFCG